MQHRATHSAADLGVGLAVIQAEPAPAPLDAERAPRPHACEVLAQLMDFPGGMKVAEQLEAPLPSRERHPAAAELGRRLEQDVSARLEALQRNALAPLVGARAPRMPGAGELHAAYLEAGLGEGASEAALSQFVARTGAPLLGALSASVRQSQIQVGTLRWEVQHDLRALGPVAERIERLDGVVHAATQARVRDAFERIEYSLAQTWEAAFRHALAELPEGAGPEAFEAWVASDGWLERFRERCVRGAQAVFDHLRRNLMGTLRAAVIAEET